MARTAEPATRPAAAGARCRCLRWKGMFLETERDPLVPNPSDGLFWCVHTMNCLGPDGGVADPADCTPDRSCYETL